MRLYFGGAEISAWRKLLAEQNIQNVSMSYIGLRRRSTPSLKGLFPDFQSVFLDSGAYTYNKRKEEFEFEDVLETAAQYMDFVKANIQYVDLVSEFDAVQLGPDFINKFREDFYNTLPPEKFMVIWHPADGRGELERLCSAYSIVGVSQSDIHGDTANAPIFNHYSRQYGTRIHGVGITSKKLLESVNWDSVSSTSWLSPSKYGDTFIWNGGKNLKRYPRDYKDKSRRSNASFFMMVGFDKDKIINDDVKEVLKLSLWSWSNYIKVLSGESVVTVYTGNETDDLQEVSNNTVGTQLEKSGTPAITHRTPVSLPIMDTIWHEEPSMEDEEATATPHLIIRSESMRICDTCFLRDKCPGFQPNSTCLYNIPIEIRTKDQLRALHDALIEMQTHRVLFMKMAEDLGGGYADPNLSSEIDRLNRMIKTKIEGDKSTFAMTVTASESASGPGIFDRMFGADAGSKLRQLEQPLDADIYVAEVLQESELELVSK